MIVSDMGIFKRGDFYYLRLANNKRVSLKTKNYREAVQLAALYKKAELDERLLNLNNSLPFSKFIDDILKWYEAHRAANTYTSVRITLENFLKFTGDKPISYLKQKDLDDFISFKLKNGYKRTSVNIDIRNLKAAFNKAVEWDILRKNPFSKVKTLPLTKKPPKWLKYEDISRLLKVIDDENIKNAFLFYVLTGIRRSELLNITWKDIDTKERVIRIRSSKAHLERYVPISDALMQVIERMQKRLGKVFDMHKDTMTHKMKKYFRLAELKDFRLHDLRHTFASLLVSSGESLKTVQELLGHTDSRTTEIYAHISQEHLKNAVNKIKI